MFYAVRRAPSGTQSPRWSPRDRCLAVVRCPHDQKIIRPLAGLGPQDAVHLLDGVPRGHSRSSGRDRCGRSGVHPTAAGPDGSLRQDAGQHSPPGSGLNARPVLRVRLSPKTATSEPRPIAVAALKRMLGFGRCPDRLSNRYPGASLGLIGIPATGPRSSQLNTLREQQNESPTSREGAQIMRRCH